MRRFFKKSLALMMVATMLLPSSVTAKEIAPTVGNKQTETPPTVTKQSNIPTDASTTTEEKQEVSTTEVKTTEASTEKDKPVNEAEVVKTDATEVVDKDVKETELDVFKEVNASEKMTQTLLIKADKESDIPKDGEVLSSYENTYLVSFPDTETAKAIYEDTKTDASLNIPFGIATGNKTSSSTIEPDVLDNLEEVVKEDDKKDSSFKITDEDYSIAVIDTGMPKSSENVEFVSMLDDKGYDDHGHGTMILESIRKQNADAKILSIKALDKNGYGDAATIYAAIKYAIERNVDIINLSISGFATEGNKIIEDIIKDAISKGIIVIGAAGNDNLPASAFIPGGIDEAIIVGACNEKNERKTFSNYGITVDYYANAGSTSEASAIVAGVLSLNNGDISKLDNKFFKTPDLSIFGEDLKRYRIPSANTNTVNDDGDTSGDTSDEGIDKPLTDEEYLLLQLRRYVNEGGFHVAGNATINKTGDMKKAIKAAYANYTSYVVDGSLLPKATDIIVSGTKWSREDNKEMLIDGNNSKFTGSWVVYDLGKDVSSAKDEPVAADCTITIPGCVRCINDNSIHDWVIKITDANFLWGAAHPNANQPTPPSDTKQNRQWLVAMQLVDNGLPKFTTGAKSGTGYTAVDSANQFWFEMSVSNAPAGSVLLTGFADLDQWQPWPLGQRRKNSDGTFMTDSNGATIPLRQPEDQTTDNSFDERISILDTSKMPTNNIWFNTNSHLVKGNYPNDDGSGINIHSTQFVQPDNKSWDNGNDEAKTVFAVKANAAESTPLYWNGCRCQTKVGLTMRNNISPSTFQTFVTYETATENIYGTYSTTSPDTTNPWTLLSDSVAEKYPGETYSYTYTGAGVDTSIWDTSKTFADPNTTAPYWTPYSIGYTATKDNHDFHLYVPRIRYTYKFDLNKPANATSNPTGQPSDITKPAGAQCGDYDALPSLKGWTFLGFYTDRTGGTKYVSTEEMWSNKTFYAHWEPKKYYVRYNGNGSTNFNENAQNGMQAGEYTQNVVTGATAYQIFTYDSAGEALRANGFSRKGYDYVCWNTTATRTGTDYNPGYVKPANVNWIKGDNTDPTATLDGVHNYPVVDLYAVWRQKLGTETLTVVSEETGNPVKDIALKLTNTANNTQVTTGTTGNDGKVTVNNLHWFPYSWSSTSVPAGYKDMQAVPFSINPANSNDNSFLNVTNDRVLYMKHVTLTINSIVSDIIKGENAPNFMYHITGVDVAGVTHSYDVMVQTDIDTKSGTNIVPVDAGTDEPYMFAGEYTVTQYGVSRYIPQTAQNVSNTESVGTNANVHLTSNDAAEVTFPYTIKQYGGFSGVHSLINKLTK